MSANLFSDEWAAGWAAEINASAAYRAAGARWESAFVLVMEPDPALGVAAQRSVYVDLSHGECRAGRAAVAEDVESATYVLRAPAAVWKLVLGGDLEPVGAMMMGLMELSRGSLISLAPHVPAAKELLTAAARVETAFPEGWD
jgi:putative sterol carrier protein